MKIVRLFVVMLVLVNSSYVSSEGWCEFESFNIISNGTKSNDVYLYGKLKSQTSGIWVLISDGEVGNTNVAISLAAQMAGKKLSIYLDGNDYTCDNFPSWAPKGEVRHLRML